MFFRLFGYSMKRTLRQKEVMFWCLAFPIILGTLFKVSFGDYNKNVVSFQQIPVACVEGEESQKEFAVLLEELEKEQELVEVVTVEQDEAKKLLKEEKVKGIFWNDKEISLTVAEEGVTQSILKSVMEEYERITGAFSNIGVKHPEGIAKAAETLQQEWNYLEQNSITSQKMDVMMDYFYALIAMACLFSCYMGVNCAVGFKADLSELAARRVAASTNRFVILLAEISSRVAAQFFCTLIGVAYLRYILGVSLGEQTGYIALVILMGSLIGVMTGVFIGSIGKMKQGAKEGVCMGITMLNCFLSGLMVGGMSQMVEEYAPFVNRINPATLMVKALYSLNIYDDYTRYTQSILSLLAIAVLLIAGSYMLVRRERYASI